MKLSILLLLAENRRSRPLSCTLRLWWLTEACCRAAQLWVALQFSKVDNLRCGGTDGGGGGGGGGSGGGGGGGGRGALVGAARRQQHVSV